MTASAIEADADAVTIAKAGRKPSFGPVLVVIIASPRPHPTVPEWEQVASATLTGYAMELAATDLGVGAVWKSGRHLEGAPMRRLLSLGPGERVLGWIVLGTAVEPEAGTTDRAREDRPSPRVTELAPDPLIGATELARRLDDAGLVVCDVRWYLGDATRGRREYQGRHIPGAWFVDLDEDLSELGAPGQLGRHPLPDATRFGACMATLGVGPETIVVVYDDGSGAPASRLWWMLDALGHRQVRVLDGGIRAWDAAGLPGTSDVPVRPVAGGPADAGLAHAWPRVIDRDTLRAGLDRDALVLLDVRAGERYRGEVEPVDPVAGHIPGAVSAPTSGLLLPDGTFRSEAELRARFEALEPDGRPVVVSCGSGVTACHTALGMRLAGLPDPLLYAGSYSDWVNAGLPVVRGPAPRGPG